MGIIEKDGIHDKREHADRSKRGWSGNDLGTLEIKNMNGNSKGTYDPKSDRTHDANGILIGGGNWLSALLVRELV